MNCFELFDKKSEEIGKIFNTKLLLSKEYISFDINLENFEYFIEKLYECGRELIPDCKVDHDLGRQAFKLYILEGLNVYMQLNYKYIPIKGTEFKMIDYYHLREDSIRMPPRMVMIYKALCEPMLFDSSILVPNMRDVVDYPTLLKLLHDVGLPFILRILCNACNTDKLIPLQKEDLKINPFICYHDESEEIFRLNDLPSAFQTEFLRYVKHIRFRTSKVISSGEVVEAESTDNGNIDRMILENNDIAFRSSPFLSIDGILHNKLPIDSNHLLCNYLFQVLLFPSYTPFSPMRNTEIDNNHVNKDFTPNRESIKEFSEDVHELKNTAVDKGNTEPKKQKRRNKNKNRKGAASRV